MTLIRIDQHRDDRQSFSLNGEVLPRLSDVNVQNILEYHARYRRLIKTPQQPPETYAELGRLLDRWLRDTNFLPSWPPGSWTLEWALQPLDGQDLLGVAICELPWEILHDGGQFAVLRSHGMGVLRRLLGLGRALPEAGDHSLGLLFQAAAPNDLPTLDYRAEEVEIALSASRAQIDLVVEEMGQLDELEWRLNVARDSFPLDVLHLSAHGGFVEDRPVLALEGEGQSSHWVSVEELLQKISPATDFKLAFISACQSAIADGADPSAQFAVAMVAAGGSAAMAWAGSVNDAGATLFAGAFYQQLAQGRSLEESYTRAVKLLAQEQLKMERPRCDWHMPRLIIGEHSGGALCRAGKVSRWPNSANEESFLDQDNREVRVTDFRHFVGRRRELQQALPLLNSTDKSYPVLLQAVGQQGKSSLAARIVRRMQDHKLVLLHGAEISATGLLQKFGFLSAGFAGNSAKEVLTQIPHGTPAVTWFKEVAACFEQPLLLVLDDLEQQLEDPPDQDSLHRLNPVALPLVSDLLRMSDNGSLHPHKLLLTSRFDFEVVEEIRLNSVMRRVQVLNFDDKELQQQRIVARLAENLPPRLLEKAKEMCQGNAGLHHYLCSSLSNLYDPEDESIAQELLENIQSALQQPAVAQMSNQNDFLIKLALRSVVELLSDRQLRVLQSMALAPAPVDAPRLALCEALSSVLGASAAALQSDCDRLLALSLCHGDDETLRVDALIPGLLPPLDAVDIQVLGDAMGPGLEAHWGNDDWSYPQGRWWLELVRHSSTLVEQRRIERVLQTLRAQHFYTEARPLVKELDAAKQLVQFNVLRLAYELLVGAGDEEDDFLKRAIERAPLSPDDDELDAVLALRRAEARRLQKNGHVDDALARCQDILALCISRKVERVAAIVQGEIADILQARGDLDEALRIRQEDQLPVYERLGEVRSIAITKGQIADILQARGDLDEALRIRREEELPVYERLGEVREIAITKGKIADILQARGDLDEALRIRQEDQLPVYERLGDKRELLVGRANLAIGFSQRSQGDDGEKAVSLLGQSLKAAIEMRLSPEIVQLLQLARSMSVDLEKLLNNLELDAGNREFLKHFFTDSQTSTLSEP